MSQPPKSKRSPENTTSSSTSGQSDTIVFRFLSVSVSVVFDLVAVVVVWLRERFDDVRQYFGEPPPGVAPRLHYRPSSLSQHVLRNVPGLRDKFRPPRWAGNAHAQLWLSALLAIANRTTSDRCERELLQLQDDGVVMLEWCRSRTASNSAGSNRKTAACVVLVVPGPCTWPSIDLAERRRAAEGRSRYEDCWTVVFRGRGGSGVPLTTPRLHSVADGSDLAQVVSYIRDCCPVARLAAVGYGLGNAPLFSYLGDSGSSSLLGVAVAISPVWDVPRLFSSSCSASHGRWLLLALHKLSLLRHARALASAVNLGAALRSESLDDFYRHVHLRSQPDDGAADENMTSYWEQYHPMRDVDDISVPLLVIASHDDPLVTAPSHDEDAIPYDLFHVYPNFFLALTKAGGHCGFVEASSDPIRPDRVSWASRLAHDYIEAVWDFQDQFDPFVDQGAPTRIEIVGSDDDE